MSWSQVVQISWCTNCAHLCDCNLVSLFTEFIYCNDFRTPWATLCQLARRYLSHNAYDSHDGHVLSKIVREERHILLIKHLKAWSPNANTKSLLATLTSPQEGYHKDPKRSTDTAGTRGSCPRATLSMPMTQHNCHRISTFNPLSHSQATAHL